jgi:hypothetical protein
MISYACSVDDTEPAISHEHTGARWIRPEQLRDALTGETGFLGDIGTDAQRFIEWRAHR